MLYEFYTPNELRPAGWLRRQLEIQANGLAGNLDKVWPDVRDSAWIGGDREGWERVPYWLDGFIPLAYLLKDGDRIARAKKYIDAILSRQQEDGWLCPCTVEERKTYDTWAVLLISKVLTVYYRCAGDERIPDALYRCMKNYYDLLSSGEIHLAQWGEYRWFEGFVALNFLWKRYHEDWIRELGKILKAQGTDYRKHIPEWKRPLNQWTWGTHVVNMGMLLKCEAVSYELLGEEYTGLGEQFYDILTRYNGCATGAFTGDECLSGLSPIQGTELCAVCEMLYSFKYLYAVTGDEKWVQLLETVGFNNLPGAISDDMWSHQYDQLANQIACQKFPRKAIFRTNGPESHLFGLEPNFGCCTANMGQGWPKLALDAFFRKGDEVCCAIPMPAELHIPQGDIVVESEYPFKTKIRYTVSARADFPFRARIPGFARCVTVNGQPHTGDVVLEAKAGNTYTLEVAFETETEVLLRPNGLVAFRRGCLVYSLPIEHEKKMLEYERDGVERKHPYCDWELIPTGKWAYGLTSLHADYAEHPVDAVPFSSQNPPTTLTVTGAEVDWGYEDGYDTVCAKVPQSRKPLTAPEKLTLVPYACARLRMTELCVAEG